MSQENVAVVRRVADVNGGGLEAAFPSFAEAARPDVELREDPPGQAPEPIAAWSRFGSLWWIDSTPSTSSKTRRR